MQIWHFNVGNSMQKLADNLMAIREVGYETRGDRQKSFDVFLVRFNIIQYIFIQVTWYTC